MNELGISLVGLWGRIRVLPISEIVCPTDLRFDKHGKGPERQSLPPHPWSHFPKFHESHRKTEIVDFKDMEILHDYHILHKYK